MDLDDIRLFVKVAELKSFVGAASELNIQNSLLSRRVARLEASLGVRLLQRTTRKVSLTEEGQQFLHETLLGLSQLQNAVDALHALHGEPKGRVRLASPIEIGQYLQENVLPGFFTKYPDVNIEWDLLGSSKSLVENGIDLSIRTMPSIEQSLIEKKIGEISLRMYRSPDFQWPFKKMPTVEELEKLPWIVFTRNHIDNQRVKLKVLLDSKEFEIRPRNIRFRTNSYVSVRHAIIQGVGIGFLPSPLSDPEVLNGRLLPILPKQIAGPAIQFFVVYPSREYLAPKVRVMIDWLTKNFPIDSMGLKPGRRMVSAD